MEALTDGVALVVGLTDGDGVQLGQLPCSRVGPEVVNGSICGTLKSYKQLGRADDRPQQCNVWSAVSAHAVTVPAATISVTGRPSTTVGSKVDVVLPSPNCPCAL